jgi:metal-dependent amidase/aminoacylase/carboxypeptidase family protein
MQLHHKEHTNTYLNAGHGTAAVLKNGPGKTLLLRADIDALPVEEQTSLPYASTARMTDLDGVEKPVMHACGHDMHITSLLAAAETLASARSTWSGTLVLVFQPAEERGGGAKAMVEGGLYEKVPVPDVVVGGHVMPFRSGVVGTKRGLIASSADSFRYEFRFRLHLHSHLFIHNVWLFPCVSVCPYANTERTRLRIQGRQGHASTPHVSIDPIVQAASTILRLQTIVAREVDPLDFAVVTVSAMHAGDAENIIPSHADLKLNVRAAHPSTRHRVLASIRRIIDAEAAASGNPNVPELQESTRFPLLFNDDGVTGKLEGEFERHFGKGPRAYNMDIPRLQGSEDFGILASSVGRPSVFFLYGGTDEEVWDRAEREGRLTEVPGNHSPFFAPVVERTLPVGVDAYVVSALTFLCDRGV